MQFIYSSIKKTIVVLGSLVIALNAQANECAAIKVMKGNLEGQTVVYELVGHNGKSVEDHSLPSQYKAVMDGTKEYYLSSGMHTLTFNRWDKRQYRLSKRKLGADFDRGYSVGSLKIKYGSMQIKVENNKRYNISVTNIGTTQELNFKITSVEQINSEQCIKKQTVYDASPLPQEIALSENLDYKLKHLMTNIQSIQGSHFTPLGFNWSFGAVFDTKAGFNTLAVFPFSFASKLKLASGDKIIEINGVDVTNTGEDHYTILYGLFAKVKLGRSVSMLIDRSGKKIELSHKYLPTIVPNVKFQIAAVNRLNSIINTADLPEKYKHQYNNLMVEIAEYAKKNNYAQGPITIKSGEKYDHAFGITGKNDNTDNKPSFLVMRISADSPAEKLDLQINDTITGINGKELQGLASVTLSAEIKRLQINQTYSVSVIRNGINRVLTGNYKPLLFPEFELILDLAERNLAYNSLVDLVKDPRKYKSRRSSVQFLFMTTFREATSTTFHRHYSGLNENHSGINKMKKKSN